MTDYVAWAKEALEGITPGEWVASNHENRCSVLSAAPGIGRTVARDMTAEDSCLLAVAPQLLRGLTKAHYADAVHDGPCVRCGPEGKPALPGSPLSKAHINARGRRAVMKLIVKNLWIESRRLHLEHAAGAVDE